MRFVFAFAIILALISLPVSAEPPLTPCAHDLPALSRTLPFVPLSRHERKAAHTLLRKAYATKDDRACRKLGSLIVRRFILTGCLYLKD